jgi:hypothetical protein
MRSALRRVRFLMLHPAWWGAGLGLVVALLPWWHHRGYLRDLYDYGLVWAANGFIAAGERPYVDFATSIQAGFLALNRGIELVGGGGYRALTWGGAGLIVLQLVVLSGLLARRWPAGVSWTLGVVLAVAGASQHTILWHNTLGVFCLALVAWSTACHPVWRRATWGWHALAAFGLVLGGVNKLNFHLIALAAASGWLLRAWARGRATPREVGVSVVGLLLAAVVVPVAIELRWTGASLSVWWHNVVGLAGAGRLQMLGEVLRFDFLLHPVHDYYGPVLLPQAGLWGLLLAGVTWWGCRRPEVPGPVWLDGAAVGAAALAAASLLATNHEIVYVGLAAGLVLGVSVWLGLEGEVRSPAFRFGVMPLAMLLGVTAWISAWSGQRSQYGFSDAPRTEYRPAESAGPAFASLRGLKLPPDLVMSLEAVPLTLPDPDGTGRREVFYGPGVEFLERHFPSRRQPGQALWNHWGTSVGPAEAARMAEAWHWGEPHQAIYALQAFDQWPEVVAGVLRRHYASRLVGPRVVMHTWSQGGEEAFADDIEGVNRMGGNVAPGAWHFDRLPLGFRVAEDGRVAVATQQPVGQGLLRFPVRRLHGTAVLRRPPEGGNEPLSVDFKITRHGAPAEDVRWSTRLELAPGQREVSAPFEVDGMNSRLLFWTRWSHAGGAPAWAGYRQVFISHTGDAPDDAPALRRAGGPAPAQDGEGVRRWLAGLEWQPDAVWLRGAMFTDGELILAAGGELWLHAPGRVAVVEGRVQTTSSSPHAAMMRVVWYKHGRLQILQQGPVPREEPGVFRAWAAEPGGWIGVLLDPAAEGVAATVELTEARLVP